MWKITGNYTILLHAISRNMKLFSSIDGKKFNIHKNKKLIIQKFPIDKSIKFIIY